MDHPGQRLGRHSLVIGLAQSRDGRAVLALGGQAGGLVVMFLAGSKGPMPKKTRPGHHILRPIGGDHGHCTIPKEMGVDGVADQLLGDFDDLVVNGGFINRRATHRNPEPVGFGALVSTPE